MLSSRPCRPTGRTDGPHQIWLISSFPAPRSDQAFYPILSFLTLSLVDRSDWAEWLFLHFFETSASCAALLLCGAPLIYNAGFCSFSKKKKKQKKKKSPLRSECSYGSTDYGWVSGVCRDILAYFCNGVVTANSPERMIEWCSLPQLEKARGYLLPHHKREREGGREGVLFRSLNNDILS